jgi:hypothetical protein
MYATVEGWEGSTNIRIPPAASYDTLKLVLFSFGFDANKLLGFSMVPFSSLSTPSTTSASVMGACRTISIERLSSSCCSFPSVKGAKEDEGDGIEGDNDEDEALLVVESVLLEANEGCT